MSEDLRIIKTRENIKSHFLILLATHPFHKITVNMLISECKINRSTFYRNYEDKYALLDKIIDELMEEFDQTIHAEMITFKFDDFDNMKQYLTPFVEFFDKYRDMLLLLYKDYSTSKIFEKMTVSTSTKFLQSMENFYKFDKKETKIAEYYTHIIARNILETMKWWHIENPDATQNEIIEIVIRSITKGIYSSMSELSP